MQLLEGSVKKVLKTATDSLDKFCYPLGIGDKVGVLPMKKGVTKELKRLCLQEGQLFTFVLT